MRANPWFGPLWILTFLVSICLDLLLSNMIHVHALFIVPVVLASYASGRYWGYALSLGLPMAHGYLMHRAGAPVSLPQLCMGMTMHILTLSLLAELVYRVTQQKKELLIQKAALAKSLEDANDSIKILRGMLPICSGCKNIREGNGYWKKIEDYLQVHSELEFSHGICPDCVEKLYPEFAGVVLRRKADKQPEP
ncbi:MAG: histidine kinase [Fibrobacteres bacterium]|nr:histidine kinase [Fibrobacterota bacterium]